MTRDRLFILMMLVCLLFGHRSTADVVGLPLSADHCTIAFALTGRAVEGCHTPTAQRQVTRAIPSAENGYFVHFDLNSNELSNKALAHLERLSNLLTGPLSNLCIKLIGHTDTTGSSGYNMALSSRRAKSVFLYLAGPGNIHFGRLTSEGLGESMPLPGIVGSDPQNRRVEMLAKKSVAGNCS